MPERIPVAIIILLILGTCAPGAASNTFANTQRWSYFNITTIHASLRGYYGTIASGDHIYYMPLYNGAYHGISVRYDTTRSFSNPTSWESFNMSTLNATCNGLSDGVAHGNYVYYSGCNNALGYIGTVARFDTTKPFTDPTSWEYFNSTRVNGTLKCFCGSLAAGGYVYLVPYYNGVAYSGSTVRYSTAGSFTDPSSWEYFNITRVNASLAGFTGRGVAHGNSVFYIPGFTGTYHGLIVRYDTTKSFTDPASWEYFNLTTLNPGMKGYVGGVPYGNYLYLIPNNNGVAHGLAVRYDTTKSFSDPASWESFNITTVNAGLKGFQNGARNGNYVYYVPNHDGTSYTGLSVRYDTTRAFTDPTSWETFDIASLDSALKGFMGGAVLGNAVYFVSYHNGISYSGLTPRYDASPAPVASFTGTPASGTAPLSITFTDTSTGSPASWSWDFGDGTTSGEQNPVHTYTSAGTYTVNLTVARFGEASSAIRPGYISVYQPSSSDFPTGGSPGGYAGYATGVPAGTGGEILFGQDSPVTEIEVVPVVDLPEILVLVRGDVSLPVGAAAPDGILLRTFEGELYRAPPGAIRVFSLRFSVAGSQLSQQGLETGDVVLRRWDGMSWIPLPTQYLESRGDQALYQATTDRMGTFAIMGIPGGAATPGPGDETTPAATPTGPSLEPVPTTDIPETTPARGIPLSLAPLLQFLAVPVLMRRIRKGTSPQESDRRK